MVSLSNFLQQIPPLVSRTFQKAAMLDAIVHHETQFRYFFYQKNWTENVDLSRLDDGEGSSLYGIFSRGGHGLLKGYDHESAIVPAVDAAAPIYKGVPNVLQGALNKLLSDKSFMPDATFCVWRMNNDNGWNSSSSLVGVAQDDGGLGELLALLPLDADAYQSWATEYYDRNLPRDAVEAIYNEAPLTTSLLKAFSELGRRAAIYAEADAIGWPTE